MKTFLVVLCCVLAVVAHEGGGKGGRGGGEGGKGGKGGRGGEGRNETDGGGNESNEGRHGGPPPNLPKGCANPPGKSPNLTDCCPIYPTSNFVTESMLQTCGTKCNQSSNGNRSAMMCCEIDCLMNAIGVLTSGKFDPVKANSVLTAQLSGTWTKDVINGVVNTCVTKAPAQLAAWQSNAPKGAGPTCSNDTNLNEQYAQCLRRELFFQCPSPTMTNQSCQALVTYGEGCPIFPCGGESGRHGGGRGHHGGGGRGGGGGGRGGGRGGRDGGGSSEEGSTGNPGTAGNPGTTGNPGPDAAAKAKAADTTKTTKGTITTTKTTKSTPKTTTKTTKSTPKTTTKTTKKTTAKTH